MAYLDYNAPIIPGGSFLWAEYARLQEWGCFAIPTSAERNHARFLFEQLQPLRQALGRPMIVTSGARTPAYTQHLRRHGVAAALQSAHGQWKGVDIRVAGMKNAELWQFCHERWPGRMENLPFTPSWVHLDTLNWGQRQRFNP